VAGLRHLVLILVKPYAEQYRDDSEVYAVDKKDAAATQRTLAE